ncbi:MAG TPA: hypothetical protein VIN74_09190 [Candidatus Limnocylindria bacterium]
MTRAADRCSPLLAVVDALCEELSASCGLTRFSIVLARRPIPVTISYEDVRHATVPLAPTAYLELEITDGPRSIGYLTLQNSLAADYPMSARASASATLRRHTPLLRSVLGSDNSSSLRLAQAPQRCCERRGVCAHAGECRGPAR